jgi:4-amino-4-deoxy-L-arabinose transferase-like glycosyltransferase
MSEVFFSFTMLAALALFMRAASASSVRNYAAAGIAAGAAAMTRPEFLVFIPGALLAALLWGQRKYMLLSAVVFIVASVLLPVAWAARNKADLGEWIFTTTHGGYTHRLAYNSIFHDEVVSGPSEVWGAKSLGRWQARLGDETSGMSEIAADEDNYKMASGFIVADWRRAAKVGLFEAGAFWKLTPYGNGPYSGVVLCVFFLFLCIAGAAGVYVAWGRGPFVPIALYILAAETLVHVYYWGNVRMRVPFHAILCVLAACAIAAFFARKAPVGATVRAVADETAYSPAG